jgi:hypothetical protein
MSKYHKFFKEIKGVKIVQHMNFFIVDAITNMWLLHINKSPMLICHLGSTMLCTTTTNDNHMMNTHTHTHIHNEIKFHLSEKYCMTFHTTWIWIWRTIRHKIDDASTRHCKYVHHFYRLWLKWWKKKEKTLNKHVFKKTHFHSIQRDIL